MTIPMGMVSLFHADSGADCEPISAVVESSKGEQTVITIENADSVIPEVGSECQVRYIDPTDDRFVAVSCLVESIDQNRLTLRATTETQPANQRSTFRVDTACSNITAQVGLFTKCQVMDISAAGIRVNAPDSLVVGASVSVRINAPSQVIDGQFSVQRVTELNGGAQIGLSADLGDKQLTRSLTQLCSTLQREQLRRRSRITSSDNIGTAKETDTMDEITTDEQREGHDDVTSRRPAHDDAWVRVPASVLAGRALPGSLVTEEGSAVASRGQVLSMDEFKSIAKDGLFATDDWSTGPVERRVCLRSSCKGVVRVVALQGNRVLKMRADLMDISRGGVRLRTPTMLNPDVYLIVDFSTPEGNQWVIGKVVHGAVGKGETSFKLGIEFTIGASQSGPIPDSAPEFAEWISVNPVAGKRRRVNC